jgi:hypothetical protein
MPSLGQRSVAEGLGTAFLLAGVVGSGIMAAKLAGGNGALALLCNTLATGAILTVLILTFGPISGAHFNPAVSAAMALRRDLPARVAAIYIGAQLLGGIAGVWIAHLMFELPLWQVSATVRTGPGQWFAEAVATFGHAIGAALCRGSLHHGGLLVHGVDVIRQSGGDHRAVAVRYIRGDRAGRGSRIYCRAARRNARGCRSRPLALANVNVVFVHAGWVERSDTRYRAVRKRRWVSQGLNPSYALRLIANGFTHSGRSRSDRTAAGR